MAHNNDSSKDLYLDEEDLYESDLTEVTSRGPFPRLTPASESSSSRSRDQVDRNLHTWTLFQDAAANTSKLYQARSSGRDGHWLNFQNAASSISMLYKESLEQQQRRYDAGFRAGVEKAYTELVEWLVQDPRYHSRKHIRTDDLLNFVYSPKNPAAFAGKLRASKSHERGNGPTTSPASDNQVHHLEAFRDALSVSSLSGAMSHFSVNRSPPRHVHGSSPSRSSSRPVDLHAFVTEEFRRHKRNAGSAFDQDEQDMDRSRDHHPNHRYSPLPKRSRFSPPK